MKKFLYYLRILLFITYLIIMFLLIDKIYLSNFISTLYFILNLLYSIIIILTILSKKEIFKTTISYNILNMGIYLYTILLFKITSTNTTLDIINNQTYFQNNFIMISLLVIGLSCYSLILNNDEKMIIEN